MTSRPGEVRVLILGQETVTLTDGPQTLRSLGLEVTLHADPLAGLVAMTESRPHVVILPLQTDAVQVDALIRTITAAGWARCLVVWAPGDEATTRIERCLDAGASGLLPPLVSGRELAQLLSIAGLPKDPSPVLRAGGVTLDLGGLTVHREGSWSQLSPALARLLESLMRAHPEPVDQGELVVRLGLSSTLALRQTVVRLRKRLRSIGVSANPIAHSRDGRYRLALADPADDDPRRSDQPDHAPAQ
jgi:DNA-binding response OmpR family regulator